MIDLVEALGSDVVVHFTINADPALTDDVKELAVDIGDSITGEPVGGHTTSSRGSTRGRRPEKASPSSSSSTRSRMHFFDLDDSSAIYGKTS